MKNSKKGSVMPIVIIGLMMVSVIAFIFLSAVLYGKIRITRRKTITSS